MRKAAGADLRSKVVKQIAETPQNGVWTASDFVALGRRSAGTGTNSSVGGCKAKTDPDWKPSHPFQDCCAQPAVLGWASCDANRSSALLDAGPAVSTGRARKSRATTAKGVCGSNFRESSPRGLAKRVLRSTDLDAGIRGKSHE